MDSSERPPSQQYSPRSPAISERGWRRPAWWSVLLTVVGALLFVRLGIWQLHRADEKEALLRRYAAADSAPLRTLPEAADASSSEAFARVQVRGSYLADRIYLLDNPRHDQRGGVEAYVPLRVAGEKRLLLVDQGFLPGTGDGKQPQLPALPRGEQQLHGLYVPPPGSGFRMGGDELSAQTHWPKTSIYLDLGQVAADLHAPLYPHVLALDADPAAIYVRQHHFDFSSMPPARHRAYAFQWFSFAVAALAIFLILHRPRRRPPSLRDEHS